MQSSKKMIAGLASAMMLSLASFGVLSVNAHAEEETLPAIEDNSIDLNEMMNLYENMVNAEESTETAVSTEPVDYFENDYYDTEGNATLIRHEDIICSSEEMQFIAVTTKDGDVFYILINFSAESDEDNVYFLNKVDDYDLYSLLYAEDSDNENPAEAAEMYADAATGGHTKNPVTTNALGGNVKEETIITEEADTMSENKGMMNNSILLVVGIIILGAIAFVIFLIKSGKLGGKKKKTEDIMDFEEDEYPDYGAVEDENE